jgi:hypothetical protein
MSENALLSTLDASTCTVSHFIVGKEQSVNNFSFVLIGLMFHMILNHYHNMFCSGKCYNIEIKEAAPEYNVSSWHTIHHLHLMEDESLQRKIGLNVEVDAMTKRKPSIDTGNSSIVIKQ